MPFSQETINFGNGQFSLIDSGCTQASHLVKAKRFRVQHIFLLSLCFFWEVLESSKVSLAYSTFQNKIDVSVINTHFFGEHLF